MKILSKKVAYSSHMERYDLNETYSTRPGNRGLVICYVLSTLPALTFSTLELEARHEEIGVPLEWRQAYAAGEFSGRFPTLEDFLRRFDREDFGYWTLSAGCQGAEISITGRREETEIGLSYPETAALNLLPILSEAEARSYAFHAFDSEVVRLMRERFDLSLKRAVLALEKLSAHPDVYQEFTAVLTGKALPAGQAITAEGFSAQQLHTQYPLSLLGAYNYLIYLREAPQEALGNLARGLPRK